MSERASRGITVAAFALLLVFIYFAALRQYYLFNADHAVQIIMAHYFRGESADFYYWGQNRLGSLIPLLLVFPIKVLELPPLACAVACSLGFYVAALVLLFKYARGWPERAAALLWFFLVPARIYQFVAYTGHPYAPALALMMGSFGLALGAAAPGWRRLACAGLVASLACWVSETSVVAILAIVWLLFERRKVWQITPAKLAAFGIGCASMLPLMLYWRSHIVYSGPDADYVKWATLAMLKLGVDKFFSQFTFMVTSEQGPISTFTKLVAGLLLAANFAALLGPRRIVAEAASDRGAPVLQFLAMHNLLYFVVILFSRHSYYGAGEIQRYWVPVIVFSGYIAFVLTARALAARPRAWAARACVLAPATIALGLVMLNAKVWPRDPEAYTGINDRWQDMRLVYERGATRVTADYWRSLPLNVLSNFKVLSVPRDFSRTHRFEKRFSKEARERHPERFFDFP